ncbi:hypothetical protein OAF56_03670 [Pirellulaceae bacterium]|nr:hypothetical protein [Pirellulaceae bacterium]
MVSEVSQEEMIYGLVKQSLDEKSAFQDAEKQVLTLAENVGVDDETVATVLTRFREDFAIPDHEAPRLMVDWGEPPRVGRNARPTLSLICKGEKHPPKVGISVDSDLDHDANDPRRQLQWEDDGIWTFCIPFRLTSKSFPCLPGQYILSVNVTFKGDAARPPRFYNTHIRLNVPDESDGEDRVLEIDGDGQSIVNLHGKNLAQFSKVVLKGGDQGIINLQESDNSSTESPADDSKSSETYEYQLKVNQQLQRRLPTVANSSSGTRTDALTLRFTSGKCIHLFARKKMTFGRGRDNDVTLRFLPRGNENDQLSKNLSRTHMVLDSVDEGILFQDKSTKGIEIDFEPVKDEKLIAHDQTGIEHAINLGGGISGSDAFSIQAQLFGINDSNNNTHREAIDWDDVCFDILKQRPCRLWQIASSSGIDCIRLSRENNSPELEEYVLLYREAKIGFSRSENPIASIGESRGASFGRIVYAGRRFWLDLSIGNSIIANGQELTGPVFFPISYGDQFQIDGEPVEIASYEQTL